MVKPTRFTLPREIEIARIAPSPDDSEGERIEIRRNNRGSGWSERSEPGAGGGHHSEGEGAYVAVVVTRRGGEQHRGQGETLAIALESLAKTLPAAAQRTNRAGSTIPLSKLRHLEALLQAPGSRLTLQRSASLLGAWKAEAFTGAPSKADTQTAAPADAGGRSTRAFADTICDSLVALAES